MNLPVIDESWLKFQSAMASRSTQRDLKMCKLAFEYGVNAALMEVASGTCPSQLAEGMTERINGES